MSGEIFVGREPELALGRTLAERARGGDGALILFAGEAGLGKTRLAQEIARTAAALGSRVAWGRAWEAGGQPSYWPWLQIFRALGAFDDPFAVDGVAGAAEIAHARFRAFDLAARLLREAAAESGLTILLDDLHAADVSSLQFLQFIARDLAGSRIFVVGTYRDVEARRDGDVGRLLAKIAREGDAHALPRLSRQEVGAWVQAARDDGECRKDELDQVFELSEGNALFVHEVLRLGIAKRGARASAAGARLAIDTRGPLGLRAILDEHLGRVSPSTRAILETASVLGRELDPAHLAAISGESLDTIARALREAVEAGLLISLTGGDRPAFSHMLVRERLYDDLAPSRRAALHGTLAEHLLASGGDVSVAAHHFIESSVSPARVSECVLSAAKAGLARLAFEDAAALTARALARHAADDAASVDLEIALGESLMLGGQVALGRDACVRAFERASRIACPERQGQAALAYGTEFMTGAVDPTMVRLLHGAIAALPEEDGSLRARVLARYAAALVPPRTSDEAADVRARAVEALAMARRLGDDDTLLFSLHHAGSALGYLISARERRAIVGELYPLAERLGRRTSLLAIGGMRVATLREQGSAREVEEAAARYERDLEGVPQPYYQWRRPMMRATLAALTGDFDAAEVQTAEALAIAEAGDVRGGLMTWTLQRMSLAHLRGDPSSVRPDAEKIFKFFGRALAATGFAAWLHAATGQLDEARPLLDKVLSELFHFPWALLSGETVCMLEDREMAARLYPALCDHVADNSVFWGPFGAVCFGPTQRVAGDVARLLGRDDDARRWYAEAIAFGRKMRAPAFVTLAEARLATLGGAPTPSPVVTHPPTASTRERAPMHVELQRDGELWRVSSSVGAPIHLKDSKGLHYLAALLARPGQELHVTQLAGGPGPASDGAAVLDARAKRELKERVQSLREQIEEAEGFGDSTRASRLEAELDAIADGLADAVGLGGRDRKLGSEVERLRINVQRRLRDAIARISEHDPAVGRFLSLTVKTGNFCMFTDI